MGIGTKLSILRSQTKYSQQDIAEKLGIDRNTYANWESEKTEPCASQISKLAEVYDVTVSELFEEEKIIENPINEQE